MCHEANWSKLFPKAFVGRIWLCRSLLAELKCSSACKAAADAFTCIQLLPLGGFGRFYPPWGRWGWSRPSPLLSSPPQEPKN